MVLIDKECGLMSLVKLKNIIEELKLLGIEGSVFRVFYEFSLRTGLRKFFAKSVKVPEISINLNDWRISKNRCFFPSFMEAKEGLNKILKEESKKDIIDLADKAIIGDFFCFSKWFSNFGNPVNWHLNPQKKLSWPTNIHWLKLMRYEKECGDIKLSWEINRFPHIYNIVRAYILTENNKYVEYFCSQLESWEKSNPYGYGINWNSGQELAIRLFAWIYALYMMADNTIFREEDFKRLLRLIYLHSKHIEKNISYAYYAVHNNHLIGESLALYVSGILFPYFPESENWEKKGKNILQGNRCINQFYKDGGYCQLSFNYQRLTLHYYIWALRVAEVNGDEFKSDILSILDRSARFLYSFMNLDDGILPNWGANDGALLNPWTTCDYSDYRPIVNAVSYITRKKIIFNNGPWHEELLWFFGKESLETEVVPYKLESKSFPITGLHVLRCSKTSFVVLRCGTISDRFGQADQLNVDIWWKGINIAIDGGSFLYNDNLQYHRFFMGTRSHNTVTVDRKDQMYLHRRFKWLNCIKAKLRDFDYVGKKMEGEHYGYEKTKGKITHRRCVTALEENSYLIKDILINKVKHNHNYTLHWLVNDSEYKILKKESKKIIYLFNTIKGKYYLIINTRKDAKFHTFRAKDDKQFPYGWHSRYYGQKLPALSICVSYSSEDGAAFTSLFTTDKEIIKDIN